MFTNRYPMKPAFLRHPKSIVHVAGRPISKTGDLELTRTGVMVKDLLAALSQTAGFRMDATGLELLGRTREVGTNDLPEFECGSSGTTGSPKVIRRTQLSWIKSFEVNRERFGVDDTETYAVLGQLSHSLSLYGFLEGLHIGSVVEVLSDLRPERQLARLKAVAATLIYATPSQLRLLLAAHRNTDALDRVRYVLCGGGKLDLACRRQAQELFRNACVIEFFGASETSFITMTDAETPDGSVGRAYPGVTIEIRDPTGQPTSGTGEIWVQSPYLFKDYASCGSVDTRWDNGFLSIGELGTLDKQGNLYLKGRRNRMITVADHNVFPEEIEAIMAADPGVSLCAALPEADTKRGHVIVAVIQGPENTALTDRLRQSCRQTLGPYATPKRFVFVEEFPLLPAGKPDLKALAQAAGVRE